MPLSDADILQTTTGGFNATSGNATVAATTAGSTVILVVTSYGQNVTTPTGFTIAHGAPSGTRCKPYIFYKPNVGAGETSYTITIGVTVIVAWTAIEVATLHTDAPLNAVSPVTATTTNVAISTGTSAATTTYDGMAVAVVAHNNAAGTTPPSFSGHTNGFAELDDHGQAGASTAIAHSVAVAYTQSVGQFSTAASSSLTVDGTNSGYGIVAVFSSAAARHVPDIRDMWGFEQRTAAGMALGPAGGRVAASTVGAPEVVDDATKARTGSGYLRLSASAAAENLQGEQRVISSTNPNVSPVLRVCARFDGGLPSADVDLVSISTAGAIVLAYRTATQKLAVKVVTGTEVASDTTVAADTWICVDMSAWDAGAEWRCQWQVDYGDGNPVPQTAATFTTGSGMGTAYIPILGWTAATTPGVPVLYDDVVVSVNRGHYPLGDHRIYPLAVDGPVTISGTTANFSTFTANGTLAAWNDTTAQGAIDDIPPTIGASADGICQDTLATGDYMAIPLATRAAVPDESIRGVKLIVCGWAASTTAATIGLRAHDGVTEHTLLAATDPAFDNSTTTPAWIAKMVRTGADARIDWTQAQLDALTARLGFSGDATPVIGAHMVMAEVAVQPVPAATLFGTLASAEIDPVTGGVLGVTVDTNVTGATADLTYEVAGSPTTVNVAANDTVIEVIEAPDAPTVNRIELQPQAEPDP